MPCDMPAIRELADRNAAVVIEDACHAPGGTYRGQRIGSIADLSIFSASERESEVLAALKMLAREFVGDLSFDPYSRPTGGGG